MLLTPILRCQSPLKPGVEKSGKKYFNSPRLQFKMNKFPTKCLNNWLKTSINLTFRPEAIKPRNQSHFSWKKTPQWNPLELRASSMSVTMKISTQRIREIYSIWWTWRNVAKLPKIAIMEKYNLRCLASRIKNTRTF